MIDLPDPKQAVAESRAKFEREVEGHVAAVLDRIRKDRPNWHGVGEYFGCCSGGSAMARPVERRLREAVKGTGWRVWRDISTIYWAADDGKPVITERHIIALVIVAAVVAIAFAFRALFQ
jgi:hypothetical protein